MLLRIDSFDGVVPRQGAYQLAPTNAQTADNVKLYSAELRSWRASKNIEPEPPSVIDPKAIYRLRNPQTEAKLWLTWTQEVDVAESVTADDTDGRIYYTGEATPRKTNFALASTGMGPYPGDYQELGVPAPLIAPTVGSTGGTGLDQTRVYVYTYINAFGAVEEESAPSPPATVISKEVGATVTVSGLGVAGPAGKYNFTKKRIYRTVGGNVSGDFRLVAEIPITQASYIDTKNDVDLEPDVLQTLDYTPPPVDLRGLVRMSGGFLAAFRENSNELWFSQPFAPYAWPAKYVLTTRAEIVGLAVVGPMLVVMTISGPELAYGQAPDTLSQEIVPLQEPCVSKRSISTTGEAALYASPNGLVAIGPSIRQRITDKLMIRDEWQVYNPASMYGVVYDGKYFGFYQGESGQGAIILNPNDRPAMSRADFFASAAVVTSEDASLFYYNTATQRLTEFDAGDRVEQYLWRSKKFRLPMPTNFGVIQLHADYTQAGAGGTDQAAVQANEILLANPVRVAGFINGHYINQFAMNASAITVVNASGETVEVRLYGDGKLFFADEFASESIKKLPSGFRYATLEVEIAGTLPVYDVSVAHTAVELKEQI